MIKSILVKLIIMKIKYVNVVQYLEWKCPEISYGFMIVSMNFLLYSAF